VLRAWLASGETLSIVEVAAEQGLGKDGLGRAYRLEGAAVKRESAARSTCAPLDAFPSELWRPR
jgi:hypothetical protein